MQIFSPTRLAALPSTRTWLLCVAVGGVFLLVALWLYMTQPLFSSGGLSLPLSVDPQRLETHVRMLSETLVPHDAAHPANLDRVATYIHQEFERTNASPSVISRFRSPLQPITI